MQPNVKNSSKSDDEEDLELLRLAALQSLKRPTPSISNGFDAAPCAVPCNPIPFSGNLKKRTKGFHGGGRIARNGYNNRVRNPNLISVPTIPSEHRQDSLPDVSNKFLKEKAPKLILPQDRYFNSKISNENRSPEVSSKFDRFNDSEKSESESEDERISASESPKKLERSDSLEALMQELENEIQGKSKESVVDSAKVKNKTKRSRESKDGLEFENVIKIEPDLKTTDSDKNNQSREDNKNVKQEIHEVINKIDRQDAFIRRKSQSPVKIQTSNQSRVKSPANNFVPRSRISVRPMGNLSYMNTNAIPPPLPPSFHPMPYPNFPLPPLTRPAPYEVPILPYGYPNLGPIPRNEEMHLVPNQMFPSNNYNRSISPLTIKTDILNTVTAPLSPRSAAFVLQNREIIERRKKSPRRSYSRSPSPQFRRSLSPRYRRSNSRPLRSPSLTKSIRKITTSKPTSPTYKRSSPGNSRHPPSGYSLSKRSSPNKYQTSTTNSSQNSPKRSRRSPLQNSVRDALDTQPKDRSEVTVSNERHAVKDRSISLSLSPSPERFDSQNESEQDKQILEARKRKFESSGTVATEGIIRLKPKSEEQDTITNVNDVEAELKNDDLTEEELLVADDVFIDCDINVEDLFSDEESDNENEGRFKSSSKQENNRGVTVMPFTQLLSNPSKNVKNEELDKKRTLYNSERNKRDRNRLVKRNRDRVKSRSKSIERRRPKDTRDRNKRHRQRSRSPVKSHNRPPVKEEKSSSRSENEQGSSERRTAKNSSSQKGDNKKSTLAQPIENRKIEIKIRSLSKYDSESRSSDSTPKNKIDEDAKDKASSVRKVKVTNDILVEDKSESKDLIINEEEDEDDDVITKNEGANDLRAQLSRKRAERQNKLPKVERVQSRLLQNALQGAVFKKSELKKKDSETAPLDNTGNSVYAAITRTRSKTGDGDTDADAEINCSAEYKERKVRVLHCDMMEPLPIAPDGKLPIHLRLGIPGKSEVFNDSKVRRKRKRSKNKGNLDQV